jgi:hypothetical protein
MKKRKLKARRKFDGKNFTKHATHRKKTTAKKAAKSARDKGKKARVVKNKQGYTVYTRG